MVRRAVQGSDRPRHRGLLERHERTVPLLLAGPAPGLSGLHGRSARKGQHRAGGIFQPGRGRRDGPDEQPRRLCQLLPRSERPEDPSRQGAQPLRRQHDPRSGRSLRKTAPGKADAAVQSFQRDRFAPVRRHLAGRQQRLLGAAAGQHPDDAQCADVRLFVCRCRPVRLQL